ncbi:unnamed protein product [Zymoseptoria tritici ST99CH_1A5]|uniref:BTB domain-containing protein n=1 Tax=Zymoseptoria tritici ST99CH_1A5 TaxID=1276529 RepID=A0A1Y6LD63_ZYMTR|nr:unnamed protein product [Zymoseptoria tritici ST99CH_1A5]
MQLTPEAYLQAIQSDRVYLIAQGHEIPVHKALLAFYSEYFALILSQNNPVKSEDGKISLPNVSIATLKQYAYWTYQTPNFTFPGDAEIEQLQESKTMLIDLWIFGETYGVARLQNEVMSALCALLSTRPLLLAKADITAIFRRSPSSYSQLRRLASLILVARAQVKNSPVRIEEYDSPIFGGLTSMLYRSMHTWYTSVIPEKKKPKLPQLLQLQSVQSGLAVHEPEPENWVLRLCGISPAQAQCGTSKGEPIELDD